MTLAAKRDPLAANSRRLVAALAGQFSARGKGWSNLILDRGGRVGAARTPLDRSQKYCRLAGAQLGDVESAVNYDRLALRRRLEHYRRLTTGVWLPGRGLSDYSG